MKKMKVREIRPCTFFGYRGNGREERGACAGRQAAGSIRKDYGKAWLVGLRKTDGNSIEKKEKIL